MRAVAVLLVLVHHAGLGAAGGYMGVDVFFVISGYLITQSILADVATERWTVKRFWLKRVRRIMPVSTLVLVSTLVGVAIYFPPLWSVEVAGAAVAQAVYTANIWYSFQSGGYFDLASDSQPLLHYWSLAVEEQFYLIYPVLLVLAARRGQAVTRRFILYTALASLAFSQAMLSVFPDKAYYLLSCRAWELLLGGGLAVMPPIAMAARARGAIAWGGIGLLAFGVFWSGEHLPFPGVYALIPTVAAAMLIWSQQASLTVVGRILSIEPMRRIGLISYSLYLWHWPVLVFGRLLFDGEHTVVLVLVSFALSIASWWLVEQPLRYGPILASGRRVAAFAVASLVVVLATGMGIRSSQHSAAQELYAFTQFEKATYTGDDIRARRMRRIGDLDGQGPLFVYWGDSHAQALAGALNVAAIDAGIWGYQITRPASLPTVDTWQWENHAVKADSRDFGEATWEFIQTTRIPIIIMHARWSYYTGVAHNGDSGHPISESPDTPGTIEQSTTVLQRRLADTANRLRQAGHTVVYITQSPDLIPADFVAAQSHTDLARPEAATVRAFYRDRQSYLRAMESHADIVVDIAPYYTDGDDALPYSELKLLYRDSNHLSAKGAMRTLPALRRLFADVLRRHPTLAPDASAASHDSHPD